MTNILSSIATRLIILFVFFFMICLGVFVWYTSVSTKHFQLQSTQSLHRDLAKNMVMENQLLSNGQIDPVALKQTFHSMMLLGPAFEIYVTDLKGNILAYSAPEGKVKRQSVHLPKLLSYFNEDTVFPLYGDDPRSYSQQKIFSAAKIYQNENVQGYLYVIIGSELEDQITTQLNDRKFYSTTLVMAAIVIMFTLVISVGLVLLITRPLRRLTCLVSDHTNGNKTQRFNRLQLNQALGQAASLEEKQLAMAIEEMSETITEQLEQLTLKDRQRKELLSYISHDLRTPLASLIGYLETWQRQHKKQPVNNGANYIEVAHKNALVLNGLVEQVFELAHLETGSVELEREPIAIAELAQDIIESFSLQAAAANVRLDFTPKDESIQVDADIAKLERVFNNLVANAIRHTPAGGQIMINFEPITIDHEEKVLIKVIDSGIGIAKEQLPRVFEAHFRASNKVDSGSTNAGLGLAIVKALLALHQSDIAVSSEVDKGTVFTFELPKYSV
ncbi:HAMP domain-containing sensor histidine kinase [Psychrobium sp. 1_MG-2023]|uniref:sensor histidine kinase n=1 Tax=Psychrobium sp. 1_MG-2023 TaxID=3062624 RepID=UPI000C328B44|nr:HAMP domain-containing sensor histidine kinase [Psychrobium sp. 1_MG-2023]MDP2561715.1 HAMP domain-containing sensor histidine kinase [Psychrobium sp. 1_MG-2023]PKF57115.1 two-component sensor histidine kinase [Alteromonadales bacterium alter-6D02]